MYLRQAVSHRWGNTGCPFKIRADCLTEHSQKWCMFYFEASNRNLSLTLRCLDVSSRAEVSLLSRVGLSRCEVCACVSERRNLLTWRRRRRGDGREEEEEEELQWIFTFSPWSRDGGFLHTQPDCRSPSPAGRRLSARSLKEPEGAEGPTWQTDWEPEATRAEI